MESQHLRFFSNVQRVLIDKGSVRVSDNRQEHKTRGEAFRRVMQATRAAGKLKATIYYADRQYTVAFAPGGGVR